MSNKHLCPIVESWHTLGGVPSDIPSATYTLRVGLHPYGKWEWLPVRGQGY
jgi:hypothetical protein